MSRLDKLRLQTNEVLKAQKSIETAFVKPKPPPIEVEDNVPPTPVRVTKLKPSNADKNYQRVCFEKYAEPDRIINENRYFTPIDRSQFKPGYFTILFSCDRNTTFESSIVSLIYQDGCFQILNKTIFEDLIDSKSFNLLLKKEIHIQVEKYSKTLEDNAQLILNPKVSTTDSSLASEMGTSSYYTTEQQPEKIHFTTYNPLKEDSDKDILKLRNLTSNKILKLPKDIAKDLFYNKDFSSLGTVTKALVPLNHYFETYCRH